MWEWTYSYDIRKEFLDSQAWFLLFLNIPLNKKVVSYAFEFNVMVYGWWLLYLKYFIYIFSFIYILSLINFVHLTKYTRTSHLIIWNWISIVNHAIVRWYQGQLRFVGVWPTHSFSSFHYVWSSFSFLLARIG